MSDIPQSPAYRAYELGPDNHIVKAIPIEAPDDTAAIAEAQRLASGQAIELWDRARLIIRIGSKDESGSV